MAANDLGAPLVRKNILGRLKNIRMTPLPVAVASMCLILVGIFLAISINPDPNGGEPMAVVRLEPEGTADTQSGLSTEELGMRTALNPEDAMPLSNHPVASAKTEGSSLAQSSRGLGAAPLAGLMENGQFGILPRIGPDGRRPSQAYSRPVKSDAAARATIPKIAIMIGGMGLSDSGTEDAIRRLPPEISLAFAPYPKDLAKWVTKARGNGHEVMLQIPMEPFDYPNNDPGPYTLRTDLSARENLQRLDWLLSRFPGYFGVTNYMGAKFTSIPDSLRPILKQVSSRGLMYVDDGTSARSQSSRVARDVGLANATADVVIDGEPTPAAIDAALAKLEKIARERGIAIGIGSGLPITIDRIVEWSEGLDQDEIMIVPISATMAAGQS